MSLKSEISIGNLIIFLVMMSSIFMAGCVNSPNKWTVDGKKVNSSDFEVFIVQSAICEDSVNSNKIKNFALRAHIIHCEKTKANLRIHSDNDRGFRKDSETNERFSKVPLLPYLCLINYSLVLMRPDIA